MKPQCFSQLKHTDNAYDSKFQREIINTIENGQDLQDYFLASSEIGQNIQEEIGLQVTDGKLNDVRVRNQIDPYYKNVL